MRNKHTTTPSTTSNAPIGRSLPQHPPIVNLIHHPPPHAMRVRHLRIPIHLALLDNGPLPLLLLDLLQPVEVAVHPRPGHIRHDGGDRVGPARQVRDRLAPPPDHERHLGQHEHEDDDGGEGAEEVLASQLARAVREAGQGDDEDLGEEGREGRRGRDVVAVAEEGDEGCDGEDVAAEEDGGFGFRGCGC